MPKNKPNIEMSIVDAQKYISDFFDKNTTLIDTFNTICNHMFTLDNGVIVRTNTEIIGLSKNGEYYRFYITRKDNEFYIKYKNRNETEKFVSSDIERYFSYNVSCNCFFIENNCSLVTKEKKTDHTYGSKREKSSPLSVKETMTEWSTIKIKADKALNPSDTLNINPKTADVIYKKIVMLLAEACSNDNFISKRDGDIIKGRFLNQPAMTLQQLGEKHGVSRERIRQREKKAWRQLTTGIYRGKKDYIILYRERLKQILMDIPDELLFTTIAQICNRNMAIGLWLQTIISNIDNADDISFVIKKLITPNEHNLTTTIAVNSTINPTGNLMRDAARFYHSQLKTNSRAKNAIDQLHAWGIKGKTIVQLGIGFHDNSFNCFIEYMIKQKSYTISQLEEANLVTKSSKGNYCDKMRNSIIIPTIDEAGTVVCFDYYITDKERLYKYPNNDKFTRSDNLYSLNLAIRSEKKSIIVVSSYEDYFKLIGLGITNVVSTYLPRIAYGQLDLLKKHFKVIMPLVPPYVNFSVCRQYCKNNEMFCEDICLQGCDSPIEYLDKHGVDTISEKIAEFERIL